MSPVVQEPKRFANLEGPLFDLSNLPIEVSDLSAAPAMGKNVFQVNRNGLSLLYLFDEAIAAQPTRSQVDFPEDQIADSAWLAKREDLIRSLRSDPSCLSREQLLKAANAASLFTRCSGELDILGRLGSHPFPNERGYSAVSKFRCFDNQMMPIEGSEFEDYFDNVGRQGVYTALAMDRFFDIFSDCEAGLPSLISDRRCAIGDAILVKALKPFEIIDRLTKKKAGIEISGVDSEARMTAHSERLVREGVLNQGEADRILKIALHTVGTVGFTKHLSFSEPDQFDLISRASLFLLRVFDDHTIKIEPDKSVPGAIERLTFGSPVDKLTMIMRRRGEGIVGNHVVVDPSSRNGWSVMQPDSEGRFPDGVRAICTMGQAQALLSGSGLEYLANDLFDGDTCVAKKSEALVDAIRGAVRKLANQA